MGKRVLLLGHTGKMGIAMYDAFKDGYTVIGKNSKDFDAHDFNQVRDLIKENKPHIVINTVAFLGIDSCEKEPEEAYRINTLYPKFLAELSNEMGFLLIHFSTDAVFNDEKRTFYTEKDMPQPLNLYGLTKYGGDCFVMAIAKTFYLLRISVLFGESLNNTQFVEKMLEKIREGRSNLKISDDVVLSPTYSRDVARDARRIIESSYPFDLYHIANKGKASLCDLIREIVKNLGLDVKVEKASYKDFPFCGIKNTYTPIESEKIDTLRPWKEAVKEYCSKIKSKL